MSDVRPFVDTNVIAYLYSDDDPGKRQRALYAINKYPCIISTQVLNEFSNVCIKKWKFTAQDTNAALEEICFACKLLLVGFETIQRAITLQGRLGYSFYDCLMIAAALDSDCNHLFSEDMADGQIIDGLKIVNIFAQDNI